MKEKRILWITGTLLVFVSVLTLSVSAFIIENPSNTATITLNQGILGNILEGQTLHYTSSNISSLDDIIHIRTSQANVNLNFDTDLNLQSCNYANYQIVVKFGDTIPIGSKFSKDVIVTTLTLASPDTVSGFVLDAAGDWTFDFEITTTANSVRADQPTTVDITVSVERNST